MDQLVEWCSVLGSGTRPQFESACDGLIGPDDPTSQVLSRLELMGYIDVDWERSGRWSVTPTALALVEGSGGHAVLSGGRTAGTWRVLKSMCHEGVVVALKAVQGDPAYPSSWFVGVRTGGDLRAVAKALNAAVSDSAASSQLGYYAGLAEILAESTTRFVPSGFQAKRFDPLRLRFVDVDVSRDAWPAGCFEQRSRGRNRYLFVDDAGTRHVLDRWVAIHSELHRTRSVGIAVPPVLEWDSATERMANLAAARLPIQWARTAVLCTGLAPWRSTSGPWTDIYDGVKATVFNRICDALAIPPSREDLSRFDREH